MIYHTVRAFPLAVGYFLERRVETGQMVGESAEVAQQQITSVVALLAVVLVVGKRLFRFLPLRKLFAQLKKKQQNVNEEYEGW